MQSMYKMYLGKGFEGIMLKYANSNYVCKRNKNWLKLKPINEMDCKVVGLIEGAGKYEGILGAIEVITEDGERCEVGSGLTDEDRKRFWDDKSLVFGKTVEVEYQEKTPDKKLRFPVFSRLRLDKD